MSTDNTLILGKFKIEVTSERFANYNFYNLDESMCLQMVDVTDRGPRYSKDSRYTFSIGSLKNDKDIPFGTARAAVQCAIKNHFGRGVRYLLIEHLNVKEK